MRCGFADNLTYDETYALFRRMADMGADEIACGRPDWIGRMAEKNTRVPGERAGVQPPANGSSTCTTRWYFSSHVPTGFMPVAG